MFQAPQLTRTVAAALRDLESDRADVRASAASDLARHGDDERAIDALCSTLSDPNPKVRAAAANGLADLGDPRAIPSLSKALDAERDVEVKQLCVAALGETHDDAARKPVADCLSAREPEVRFQAVIAFPRLAKDRDAAVAALLEATEDPDALVRHIALRMSEELGDGTTHGIVDPRILTRAKLMIADTSEQVALVAAIVVARAGSNAGNKVLIRAAKGTLKTPETEDLSAALELCGELKLENATPALQRRAAPGFLGFGRDPAWWHARVALVRMGDERAVDEVLKDLHSWDRHKRTLAVAAAGRAGLQKARPRLEQMRGDADLAEPDAVEAALAELEEKVST